MATAEGDRPIAALKRGDLVYSWHEGEVRLVPVLLVQKTPVENHAVARVVLDSGAILEVTALHPLADGRPIGALAAGDRIGQAQVIAISEVEYEHSATYDILPASDSGAYLSGGIWLGSTLGGQATREANAPAAGRACEHGYATQPQ